MIRDKCVVATGLSRFGESVVDCEISGSNSNDGVGGQQRRRDSDGH